MTPTWIAAILIRDLNTLKRELARYATEEDVWKTPPGVTNSAGTLALHLAGNLQHYVGARLGGTGYVRDRDAEFSRRNVSRAELCSEIDSAIAAVAGALRDETALEGGVPFPERVGGYQVDAGDFVLHLVSHLAYHLGQVDGHRRIVTGESASVQAVAIGELASAEKG